MNAQKRRIQSGLLGRDAHADVFDLGTAPRFLFVLFGGSGIDDEEYARRAGSVIPVFDQTLLALEAQGLSATLVHVTAPYDVPFARFAAEPAAARTWNAHVLTELLDPWAAYPYLVGGFSGGAALALHGLHREPRCFGGAVFGADAVPPDFSRPGHWVGPLRVYATPDDRVAHAPANRRVVEALAARGQAEEFRLRAGGHRLADYATPECLGELLGYADRVALPPSQ